MISPPVPNSFQHVAHMGMDETGSRANSWNVAPEWTHLLEKLGGYGVNAEAVEENLEFVQGFLAGVEAVKSSPKNSPTSTPLSTPPCTSDEEDDYFHVPCMSSDLLFSFEHRADYASMSLQHQNLSVMNPHAGSRQCHITHITEDVPCSSHLCSSSFA